MAYDELLGGKNSFEYVNSPDRLKYFLNENFIDVIGLMPELEDDYFKNPTGTLITIKCFPWIHNKIALLGDSAHAIVPFFGQGMNAAFEDCVYLNGYIEKFGDDWNKILDEYQKDRKVNADAIADLAQENFIEMRDLVATEKFQFKKKIESELYKKYPTRFIPKYTMVTFMRIPYKTALVRGKIQEKILNQLSDGISDLEKVNWSLAEKLIDFQLSEI